jgi:hypothetical protein
MRVPKPLPPLGVVVDAVPVALTGSRVVGAVFSAEAAEVNARSFSRRVSSSFADEAGDDEGAI